MTSTYPPAIRGGGRAALMRALANREDFHTAGALRGENGRVGSTGYLTGEDLDLLHEDANVIDYVVYSYSTPIAWHRSDDDTWLLVGQKFSVTTSKHQAAVRMAVTL